MNKIMNVFKIVLGYIKHIPLVTLIIRLYNKISHSVPLVIMAIIILLFSANQIHTWYSHYMVLYIEANKDKESEESKKEPGLVFTQIDDNLYTLTGAVGEGDCERIVPDLPQSFTVILESPGGSLSEGSCLAAHFKLRDVVTVVRGTEVFNENGKVIYTPGTVNLNSENTKDSNKDKSMCASACGLLFLAGDKRYLIGDVLFGIHGPRTPLESITKMHPAALEASAYRTAAALIKLLERLGVDEALRLLFIQIPSASMYWLHPRDFNAKPELVTIATNYKNFWSYSASNSEAALK